MKNFYQALVSGTFRLRQYLLDHVPYKIIFVVTGLLATIWFLLRVIPKPSRATYPCMQAAAPIMSGLVVYLLTFTGSFFAFRKANSLMQNRNYLKATLLISIGVISATVFFVISNYKTKSLALSTQISALATITAEPPDGANNPMGEGMGIFPGRVVWAWDSKATNAACNNTPGNAFWDLKNNNTLIIKEMVDQSVIALTGAANISSAWDSIFYNHNRNKHNQARGYQNNEKIYIKVNQGTAQWALTTQDKNAGYAWPNPWPSNRMVTNNFAATETGPYVVLNILRHLVNVVGVPQQNIAIGDPMSHTFKHNFDVWFAEFPNVKYTDKFSANHNRTMISASTKSSMRYSDDGRIMTIAVTEKYFPIMEEADYLINVACLKPHLRAGITLTAKNHFGSISRSGAAHLHPSLIFPDEAGRPAVNQGYKKYRVAVDIMRHKFLGQNTLLYVVEGLFGGGPSEIGPPVKWKMQPFNNNWCNSIFMSLDQVALESVCFDFLRAEFNGINQPQDWPNALGVDDYLHQAADSVNWPKGIIYNPDGRGPFKSIGVHEHWNNKNDMLYSRNLGTGNGIELIKVGQLTSSRTDLLASKVDFEAYPNPFSDQFTCSFTLQYKGLVDIKLFDLQGRVVANLTQTNFEPGWHEITWSAAREVIKSGVYLLTMKVSDGIQSETKSIRMQHLN